MTSPIRAAVLTASDRCSRGERRDESGLLLQRWVEDLPADLVAYRVVPDEREAIETVLCFLADHFRCDLVLTTGGTGLSPRDVTPEATRKVLDREAPGIAQALRAGGQRGNPLAMLSRGVAGVRGRTLIVNLPGSPRSVSDAFEVLQPVLVHAVELLRDEGVDCHSGKDNLWNPSLQAMSPSSR